MLIKRKNTEVKPELHPRNKHRRRYDFNALVACCPELAPFVVKTQFNDESINYFNPEAVRLLNAALLKYFYGIENWQIPKGYLCPPVPGRADYIHYMADLLEDSVHQNFADGKPIKCLDVGVGANCIYPIIGNKEYGWSFVGSDIDPVALESAARIVESNPGLSENIELRLQKHPTNIFREIIQDNERFSLTICNPPFHSSPEEANQAALRKLRNLKGIKSTVSKLNFGGQSGELWCEGGEKAFVLKMIFESCEFAQSCLWFTTLISKEANLKVVYFALKKVKAVDVRTIEMAQGNKKSRIVAWTFYKDAK